MTTPLLTIGILSWNRLHYLRATLESAKRCITYPNIQWIVIDNMSEEPGLTEYLEGQTWIDDLLFLKSDHVTAMNKVLTLARGELLLMWPDDMQFIVEGDWMSDCVEVLLGNKKLGSLGLNSLRRITIQQIFQSPIQKQIRPILSELKWFGRNFRIPHKLASSRHFNFYTFGWHADGIVGSGIPSLTRTHLWRELGGWRAPGTTRIIDSSGGGETDILARWRNSELALQRVAPYLPVAADILNDPLGTKAKVRKNVRYGVYTPPPQGTFYYEIVPQAKAREQLDGHLPLAFEDFVKPLGFNLPLDQQGNLLKAGINLNISEEIK